MQFVDVCALNIKAGNGGNGALAWRREAHYSHGGPFGGNGGKGGDVIFVGDNNVNTLFHLRNLKNIIAPNGEDGASKICHGANGEKLYVHVPCGTVVTDLETNKKLFDITYHGQEQLVCKGGKGGFGNAHFKSAINQAPSLWERGDIGEKLTVKLEIQSIADVGLLGFPNAGKSTLLKEISNAKPKIAPYPFTTLTPVLGVVENNKEKLVFADIPGLIEDASENKGLGHDFLKHLNRCKVLLHLISSYQEDGSDPVETFTIIEKEIKKYSIDLYNKPRLVVLTKTDLLDEQEIADLKEKMIIASKKDVYCISSLNKPTLKPMLNEVFVMVNKIQAKLDEELVEINIQNFKPELDDNEPLIIKHTDYGWELQHSKLRYWVNKIPQNTIDNRLRLKQKMETLKVFDKLKEVGAQKGDMVVAYGHNWSYLNNDEY